MFAYVQCCRAIALRQSHTRHLQAGQVELVLSLVEQQWAHVADPSHVRYFIFKVSHFHKRNPQKRLSNQ